MAKRDHDQHPAGGPPGGWKPLTADDAVTAGDGDGEPLQLVLDDIADYAVFMVGLDGRIASWNSGAQRMKGYTSEEAIGMAFARLFTEEDRQAGKPQKEMQEALEKGVYQGEGPRQRKDGSIFYADVTLRLIKADDGSPKAFVKVTRDITERKKHESAEADRADFEKQLIGIVSHDLRNPLSAILMSAGRLLRRSASDPGQAQTVERMVSSAQRAIRLVDQLLDFTQARLTGALSIKPSPIDANAFTTLVVEELRLVHPDQEIVVAHSGDGAVEWDPDRIAQLLTNLVNNALRHGGPGAPVTVSTRGETDSVVLEVHNLGDPIPSALLPHLFERLVQGTQHKKNGSIGLGLFIVRHIVRAHAGSIDVHSTAGQGTTFTVRLPRRVPA